MLRAALDWLGFGEKGHAAGHGHGHTDTTIKAATRIPMA
jgi:hypothetical protein